MLEIERECGTLIGVNAASPALSGGHPRVTEALDQLGPALDRLETLVAADLDEVTQDAALHRFQVCFELCWRSVRERLAELDVDCASPPGCMQAAVRQGWVEMAPWTELIELRNQLPACCEKKLADEIVNQLPDALGRMRALHHTLSGT